MTVDILLFIAVAAALPTLTFAFLPRLKNKCLTIDATGVHILSGARNIDFLWGDLKRARAEIRSSAGWGVTPGGLDLLTAETLNFVSLFKNSGIPGSESTYVMFEEFGIASVRLASIINAGISKLGGDQVVDVTTCPKDAQNVVSILKH